MSLIYFLVSCLVNVVLIRLGLFLPAKSKVCLVPVLFCSGSDQVVSRLSCKSLLLFFTGAFLIFYSLCMMSHEFPAGIFLFIWSACSIVLTVSDLAYYLLPNRILFFFFIVLFVFKIFFQLHFLGTSIEGGIFLFVLFAFFFFLFPQGLGGGDVKLAGLIGFTFGWEKGTAGLLVACAVALIYIFWNHLHKKEEKISMIAFGPFLFAGTWILFFLYKKEFLSHFI